MLRWYGSDDKGGSSGGIHKSQKGIGKPIPADLGDALSSDQRSLRGRKASKEPEGVSIEKFRAQHFGTLLVKNGQLRFVWAFASEEVVGIQVELVVVNFRDNSSICAEDLSANQNAGILPTNGNYTLAVNHEDPTEVAGRHRRHAA